MTNRLLDGFAYKLTSGKYAELEKNVPQTQLCGISRNSLHTVFSNKTKVAAAAPATCSAHILFFLQTEKRKKQNKKKI